MKKFLRFSFIPASTDKALLILRVLLGLSLFVKHGYEKLSNFSGMQTHFPNPLHIGATPGLLFATLSDGICSILVILGLATRPAALIIAINMFVVFTFMRHEELVFAFLAGFLSIFFAGAGKYSLDHKLLK